MIAYFPKAYPDELLYSQLARYFTSSGYMAYIFAAEELFISKTVRPNIEFVNYYTSEAFSAVTKNTSMEEVVIEHTMFPYYGRFLPKERRDRAFRGLVSMNGNFYDLMPIPLNRNGNNRHLRFCTSCAAEDREKYGETYWHRVHQLIGINICPFHGCRLADSSVIISSKVSPALIAADPIISDNEAVSNGTDIEQRLAKYMASVFQGDVDMQSDIDVGDFIHSRMEGTKYCSRRGEQRNMLLFHKSFSDYYANLPDNCFTELWQIQKVLTNERLNFNEICMLAMLLGITAEELSHMKLPEKSQQELFDEEIHTLHNRGMKYPDIAQALGASYNIVKAIGENRYGTYHKKPKIPKKSGKKPADWERMDIDTLPKVKKAITELRGGGNIRPRKVTVSTVERIIGLPYKTLSLYMPLCYSEVQQYFETQQQYWAREVVWAAKVVLSSGSPLVWRRLRDITNLRKRDFESCLPYIDEFAEADLAERIRGVL